jgi:hypothetical protein
VGYGETVRARPQSAKALGAFLASGDAGGPRALGLGGTELSEALSWLIQDLLEADADEHLSLDGLIASSVRQDSAGSISLAGCVVTTDEQRFRPVLATLSLWPGASTIRVGGKRDEMPWSHGGAERVPVPTEWRYTFRVSLPPTLSAEQLATWVLTGFAELRQLLYWQWDPIGVNDAFPRTANEYDSYVHTLLGRLHHGDRRGEIARFLRDGEVGLLGERRSDPATLDQFAERLIEWYENSLASWLEQQLDPARPVARFPAELDVG